MLDDAALVFFSGGNPAALARALAGTPFWASLLGHLSRGLAYAGCSAGAASLGILAPDSQASRGDGGLVWEPGLGLLPRTCVFPHWDGLERYRPGLTRAVLAAVPPGARLVAVDENTALAGDGTTWWVTGAGGVHILEGGDWRHVRAGGTFELGLLDAGGPTTGLRDDSTGAGPGRERA
jgi:cyanophycinase